MGPTFQHREPTPEGHVPVLEPAPSSPATRGPDAGSAGRPQTTPERKAEGGHLVDPIVVGLVSLGVYLLHGFNGLLTTDLALFTYGGERVARGVPPYVGVFNTVGPLADAVPGLAVWGGQFFGVGPLLSIRVAFTCLSALSCALLCILARDTFGSRAAGLAAPAVFLIFENFISLASDGPREKTTMVVFLIATLIFAGRRRWIGAGVCTALATLTWQPAFLVAAVVVLVGIVTSGESRRRGLARFIIGGAIPSALCFLWFALEDALRPALDGFVIVNLRYTSQPSALDDPGHTWRMLRNAYPGTLVVALLGIVAMLLLAVGATFMARRSSGSGSQVPLRIVSVGAGCLVGCVWTLKVINGGPDLFELLPFAALGLAGVLTLVTRRLPRGVGSAAVAVVVCAGVGVAGVESVSTRDYGLLAQRADVYAVMSTQPRDATILTIDASTVLAISGRDNIWQWQLFDGRMLMYLDATQPGGLPAVVTRFATERPTFVAMAIRYPETWQQGVLRREYWRIGRGPGWVWYLSRTAGRAALLRARAANTAALNAHQKEVRAHPWWTR